MQADDIPTDITQLTYTAPGPTLSQNQAAVPLAHYWPAIAAHVQAAAAGGLPPEAPAPQSTIEPETTVSSAGTGLDETTGQAVAAARRDIHELLVALPAPLADQARAAIRRLEDAIRRQDAEFVRTDTWGGDGSGATGHRMRHAALIDPGSPLWAGKTT